MSKQKISQPEGWEIKDRNYYLTGSVSPITFTIPSKHTRKHPLLWFDEGTATQRELRYATNQSSVFVDEQKGEATMGHIMFTDGVLAVKKEQQALQKLLSIYHPLKTHRFKELEPQKIAITELDELEYEINAMNAARDMDIDHAEAVLRVEVGSDVNKLSSKELRRYSQQ